MTTRKRRPKSRSGPTIPESERGTVQVNARVPRSVRAAYEREAEARGVTLGALVRERLESAEWVRGETQSAPPSEESGALKKT